MPNRVISVISPCGTESGLAYDGANAQETAILRPLRFLPNFSRIVSRSASVCVGWSTSHCMLMIGTLAASAIARMYVLPSFEHEVVADADAVAHRGENLAGVGGRFAVADLRGVGVEEVGMTAELRHAGLEGVAGPRRLVEEQEERGLMRQQQRRLAAAKLGLQLGRRVEQQLEFVDPTGPGFRCSLCPLDWP